MYGFLKKKVKICIYCIIKNNIFSLTSMYFVICLMIYFSSLFYHDRYLNNYNNIYNAIFYENIQRNF